MPVWGDYRITWRQILPPAAVVVAVVAVAFTVRSCRDDQGSVNRREQHDFYLQQLGNPDPAMVAQAVRRIGEYGDPKDSDRLRPKLDDRDPRVVGAACEALGRLGDATAKDRILAGLGSGKPAVAAGAAAGAGALELNEAVEPLSGLLKSSNHRVRLAAIVALGDIGDAKAITALERLEADPSSGIRGTLPDEQRAELAEAVGKALATLRGTQ